MSLQYDIYLENHKANVQKGYEWLVEKLPLVLREGYNGTDDLRWLICADHDKSKTSVEEYDAYDKYFYGRNKSFAVIQNFNKAWLHHIHHNPHHWQHWVLINDDPKEGEVCIEMPHCYVIEMICDWWSFSWARDNLYEIFNWYDEHKEHIKLHSNTRKTVESILDRIKDQLLKDDGGCTEP